MACRTTRGSGLRQLSEPLSSPDEVPGQHDADLRLHERCRFFLALPLEDRMSSRARRIDELLHRVPGNRELGRNRIAWERGVGDPEGIGVSQLSGVAFGPAGAIMLATNCRMTESVTSRPGRV